MIFAGLFLACSAWAADEKPTLAFYIVGPEKIEGGRFIDTKAFPKLGHIAAKPELVIAALKEACLIKRLADFTSKNVGKIILLLLGNEPLIAPRVLEQIRTPTLQISLSNKQKRTRILQALKRLVRKPKH